MSHEYLDREYCRLCSALRLYLFWLTTEADRVWMLAVRRGAKSMGSDGEQWVSQHMRLVGLMFFYRATETCGMILKQHVLFNKTSLILRGKNR